MAREPRRTRGATEKTTSRRSSRGGKKTEPKQTGRSRYRGEEGRRQAAEEQERIKQRREQRRLQGNQPFRYWMPPNTERKVIVLDESPDFYRYEHALMNRDTNRNDLYTDCVNEFETCPVCENSDSRPYYAMYLTVIDLEGFTTRGGEEVEWSRKLFVVKSGMQRQWVREFERNGSLRGKVFTIFRDGDKDPVTGNQIEEDLEEEPYSDADLADYERSWTDRDKKEHTEDCSVPYAYDEIMPEMSFDELNSFVGGNARPAPGSRRSEEEELETGEEEETTERADDDGDWQEPDTSEPPFDSDENEEEEEKPRRGRRSSGRGSRKEPEPEPEEKPERGRRGTRSSRRSRRDA